MKSFFSEWNFSNFKYVLLELFADNLEKLYVANLNFSHVFPGKVYRIREKKSGRCIKIIQ